MGYQFFLPMVLRWRASRAEAPLKGLMRDYVTCSKFSSKLRSRNIFSIFVFLVMFSRRYSFCHILLLWELVHDKILNFHSETESWWWFWLVMPSRINAIGLVLVLRQPIEIALDELLFQISDASKDKYSLVQKYVTRSLPNFAHCFRFFVNVSPRMTITPC